MLSGQETGEDYRISVNASSTEVWKGDIAFTLASDSTQNAGLTTKITELDEFTLNGGLQGDEKITINGKNRFGTDLAETELSVTANTTVGHLIDSINDHFDGVATARFENGAIYVTDHIAGTSLLEVSLAYDNGATGDTALTMPTMAVLTEGGGASESLASLGSASFIQTQSARSSEIKIDGYPSSATQEVQTLTPAAVPTGGHYHLSYGGETTGEIAHDASLAEIKTALELLSTVNTDDITVGGDTDDGLAIGALTFTFNSSLGNVEMISIDDTALTGGASPYSFVETTEGNAGWLRRNGNSVSDALSGITLNLNDINDVDSGDNPIPIEVTISRNPRAVSSKIKNLVSAYNSLITELKSKTEYNAETKEMGVLSNDIAVSFIKTQSRDPFIGTVAGFVDSIDTYIQSMDIGLTIDTTGVMEFDTDEFNDAMNDDYINVLELLGATKGGNSSNANIPFYSADANYTTAGTYDVEVDISANAITDVRIKLSTESSFRDNSTWATDLVTGMSIFDDDGNPVYPEHGLQFTVDLTQDDGTYTATINVKQGIAGALEELLDEILEADGRLDVSKDILNDRITAMERRIELEEARLTKVETRLIARYARLEKTLTMMQQQMAAVSMVSQVTFGS